MTLVGVKPIQAPASAAAADSAAATPDAAQQTPAAPPTGAAEGKAPVGVSDAKGAPLLAGDPPDPDSVPATPADDDLPGTATWRPKARLGTNLKKYGFDLTQEAAAGNLRPAIGRARELEQITEILGRPTNNNPVMIGESGTGKTAIFEELARKVVAGEVPPHLQNTRMVMIDLNAMTAGTTLRGQFEERLNGVIKEVEGSKGGIIPIIDEIHMLTSAGAAKNTPGAAQALKPALARGKLRLLGATTPKEYDDSIRPDAALHRRFSNVTINEPNPELTTRILQGTAPWLEGGSGLKFTNDALHAVQEMSNRYVVDRFQPAKAIEVASQTVGRLQMLRHAPPREVNDMREQVIFLTNEHKVLSRETSPASKKRAAEIAAELKVVKTELDTTLNMWEQAAKIARGERPDPGTDVEKIKKRFPEMFRDQIVRNDVAKSVAERTGIPVGSITDGDRKKLIDLEANLGKMVIGQDKALTAVSSAIRRGRTGVADPGRPTANILMLGPPGVGKTETAKATATVMFDNVESLQRFNMGEYGTPGSRERLVNDVSDAIRKRPYSVVLFDEIEKGHPSIYDAMMTALGEGKLKDSHGRTGDLSNAVVLLASNMKQEDLPRFFRPEFIDRMDDIIEYQTLSRDSLSKIADIQIGQLTNRISSDIALTISPDAKGILVDRGYSPDAGARNLKRVIERTVGDAVANMKLDGSLKTGMGLAVGVENGELTFTPVPAKK